VGLEVKRFGVKWRGGSHPRLLRRTITEMVVVEEEDGR
jgi:hypothetical protein